MTDLLWCCWVVPPKNPATFSIGGLQVYLEIQNWTRNCKCLTEQPSVSRVSILAFF